MEIIHNHWHFLYESMHIHTTVESFPICGGSNFMDKVAIPYPSINVPHVKSKQSLFMIYTSGSMNLHQTPRTSYEKLKIQEKLAKLILNEISQYTVHNNPEGKLDFLTTIACMCNPMGSKPQLYK